MLRIKILCLALLFAPVAHCCTSGGAQPTTGQTTTGLQAALGGNIKAVPFAPNGATGEPITVDTDLECAKWGGICRWTNTGGDQLDWTKATGRPNPTQWEYATGTNEMPSDPSMMLASNPRKASETGVLKTDPINCQIGDGELTFKHWISRAREEGKRPKLNVCWRYVGELDTNDCTEVTGGPGPSTVTIPEVLDGPFEIVFLANNFVQSPEGGFVFVDDVRYEADVRDDCDREQTTEATTEGTEATDPTEPTDSPTTEAFETTEDYGTTEFATTDSGGGRLSDAESCALLVCGFGLDDRVCAYNTVGEAAKHLGARPGWEVVTGDENPFNPLTGIKRDVDGNRDGAFNVATFPDPAQTGVKPDTVYDLESPPISFSKKYFMKFWRYIATEGLQLKMCQGGGSCFYESRPLMRGRDAFSNRKWIEEVVPLPQGDFPLHAIAQYDGRDIFNRGQVGLSRIEIFEDNAARRPLC